MLVVVVELPASAATAVVPAELVPFEPTMYMVGLEFNIIVNNIKVMLSHSVYLNTLFLGRYGPLSYYPVLLHILQPETDKCPT